MAIGLSHLFSSMVGSVGGTTYFYNRYASIVMRARVSPTDPRTVPQQTVRARMSAAVTAWQGLTVANRQSWEDYAAGTPWMNALGQDVRLTGFNMYLAVRLAVRQINPAGDPSLMDQACCLPGMNISPRHGFQPLDPAETGFGLILTNPHPTDNMRVGIHMSTAQNPTVNFWKGPYDSTAYQATASIPAGLSVFMKYKTLTAGKRYFLRIRGWNNTLKNLVSTPTLFHRDAVAY